MIKILTKKILCCLLCLSLFFSLLIVPSHKVYAGGLKNITDTLLRISDNADGNFTWSGMHYLLWSDDETYSEVRTFLRKGINTAASMYGAAMSNNWAAFCSSFADFLLSHDAEDATVLSVDGDNVFFTDEFMNLLKDYLDSLKDENGNYKSDSGISGINYQLVHTSTYSDMWENYYDSAKDYYSFAHFSDLDDFLTDFKNYYESNPIPMAGDFKYKPNQPDFMVIVPSKLGCYFFCTSVMAEYYESDDNTWFYYLGSVDSDTGVWTITPKYMDVGGNGAQYGTGILTFKYDSNGLNSPNSQPGGYIGSDQNNNSYKNMYAPDDAHIPQIGTPKGGYIKLFATDDDARAYYNAVLDMNIPDYPYSGGNVYITNTNITYNNPDAPDEPDNPDSPDTPSGDDDNIWHDPSDDVPDAPFSGTVTEGIETIIKYLKKIYHQLILNNVLTGADLLNDIFNNYIKSAGEAVTEVATVAKNKFPFCIPGVIVTAITLTAVEAAPPKFEIPFKFDRLGIDYKIEIDLTSDMWQGCRNVLWYMTLFLFIMSLIKLTILMTRSNN